MSSDNEKKGLIGRLVGGKKTPKCSCCFEVEEIPEAPKEKQEEKESTKDKDKCCCNK